MAKTKKAMKFRLRAVLLERILNKQLVLQACILNLALSASIAIEETLFPLEELSAEQTLVQGFVQTECMQEVAYIESLREIVVNDVATEAMLEESNVQSKKCLVVLVYRDLDSVKRSFGFSLAIKRSSPNSSFATVTPEAPQTTSQSQHATEVTIAQPQWESRVNQEEQE